MFFGYISTFFVAILLSLFYISYAASNVFDRIKKEIKKEYVVVEEITNENNNTFNLSISLVDNFADTPKTDFVRPPIEDSGNPIIKIKDSATIKKIYYSDIFQRPPPILIL